MFKNSSGGTTQTVIGDGSANGFSFDSKVEDTARLQVFVNDRLIPETSPANSTTVTNYTVDTTNGFLTFETDTTKNPSSWHTQRMVIRLHLNILMVLIPTLETVNTSIAINIVNIESNSNAHYCKRKKSQTGVRQKEYGSLIPDVRSNIIQL